MFGVTFQNYVNYALDVKNCIGLGDVKNIDNLSKIRRISMETGADDFIKNYKTKYYTHLSRDFYDDGIEPSGGQWQKLAITRSLYSDAPILILDEPTSALDPRSEDNVMKILSQAKNKKIVIMISHRMYSARLADKIIFFDKGEIKFEGSHEQMMHNCEQYMCMFNIQAEKYRS